jgi:alternate signal-mediated exported protein
MHFPRASVMDVGQVREGTRMKRTTKGALAGGAAAVLLLGGVGSLAYWTADEDVTGTDIDAGHVTLSAPDCTTAVGSHDWQLDTGDAYVGGTTLVVPGDSISKVCDMSLDLDGDHIGANLAIDATTLTGDATLSTELAATATFTVDGGAYAPITAPGTHAVRATITVTFNGPGGTNGSMDDDVNLDDVTVLATQTHI